MTGLVLDAVIAFFVGHAIWRGWRRGIVRAGAKVVGLIVAAVAAAVFHGPLASIARALGVPDRYDDLVGALVVFAAVIIGFRFAGDLIAKTLRMTKIGGLADAGVGASLSGLWALALTTLVLIGMSLFEGSSAARAVDESQLGSSIVEAAPDIADAVANADLRGWLLRILRPEAA